VRDLDRASLDRILPDTPGSADWNDVMSRFHASRSGPRRRRLVMLAATALVAIVGTASAIGGVRDLFFDRGFIGLPPVGATPSAPESAELVLSFFGRSTTLGGTFEEAYVYADGRVIWQREGGAPTGANDVTSGFLERRLTSDGVKLLRSEVISTGLFGRDLTLISEHDFGGRIQARNDGRLVRVRWINRALRLKNDPGTTATPEQEHALARLDALLSDPAASLPPRAWHDGKVRAYVAPTYAVCWGAWEHWIEPSGALALLPASVQNLFRSRGIDRGPFGAEDCSTFPTKEARALAEALDDAGLERVDGAYRLAYRFEARGTNGGLIHIYFEPRLPHGYFTCTPCG
jgi:hypothetical protein